MIKRLIEKLKALSIGNSSNKHDCREHRVVIDKTPLLEGDGGDSYISPPKYYMGDAYNVKCKICGISWWQNYP